MAPDPETTTKPPSQNVQTAREDMPALAADAGPHPFFLAGSEGPLFCVYHPPMGGHAPRETVLIAPPFAEEMNRTRRMATLVAQALAERGVGTLSVDLWGTGDSGGDFADARWPVWIDDLARAADWLRSGAEAPVSVLGIRLGATMACALAAREDQVFERLLFWQPVSAGKAFMNGFLRIRVAAGLTGEGEAETTGSLRALAQAGEPLEIAGYELAPGLVEAIDGLDLAKSVPPESEIAWYEVIAAEDRPVPPASKRVIERWQEAGAQVTCETVIGEPFWSLQETTLVPALIDRAVALFASQ